MSVAHGYWTHSDPHAPAPELRCVACHDRPRWTDTLMCGGCFVRLRSDIATIVTAHAELGADMQAIHTGHGGGAHTKPGSRLPFGADQHDKRVQIEAQLTGWARIIAEEHQPAIHGPADGSMPTVGQWVADLLPWVTYQDWCDAMALELGETALSVRALVATEPRRRELPGICPGCRMLSLVQYDGDTVVLCRIRDCGRRLTQGEYQAMFHGPVYKTPGLAPMREISPAEIKPPTSIEGVAA